VPVVVNGQTVGAVGVSGVTSQQDEQIAEAGSSRGIVTVNHLGDAPLILGSRGIHSCRVAIR